MNRRIRIRAACSLLAACSATLGCRPTARAQSTPTFAVDRLVLAGAPGDGFAVWRPDVAETTRFFGQLGLGFAVNPLRVDNYVDNLDNAAKLKAPLSMQLITYLDVGVEILNRASIQVSFPFVAYQAGNPTNVRVGAGKVPLLPQSSVDVRSVAPGDTRIEARVILFRSASHAFKLGVSAAMLVPTGNRLSFAGDGSVGASFGLAAEVDVKVAYLTLNAGYRLRPTVVLNELLVGSEVVYALGVCLPLRKGTIRLGAELFGGFGASPGKAEVFTTPTATTRSNVSDLDTSPIEWMLNGKMWFTAKRQAYAGLGVGGRLDGGYAPDFRAVAIVGGAFSP